MSTLYPWEVRQQITERITALSPDASYQQLATDAWIETKAPLIPEIMPDPLSNLAFFCDDRALRLLTGRQSAADGLRVEATVIVRFLYRLRTQTRVDDWDRAAKAAHALVVQLDGWQPADFDLYLENSAIDRQVLTDFVAVSLRFTVQYFAPTGA